MTAPSSAARRWCFRRRNGGDEAHVRRSRCPRPEDRPRLLEALAETARAENLAAIRLETGIHQPEAIGLYRSGGYTEIPPFGSYQPDPLSLFMEKRLR